MNTFGRSKGVCSNQVWMLLKEMHLGWNYRRMIPLIIPQIIWVHGFCTKFKEGNFLSFISFIVFLLTSVLIISWGGGRRGPPILGKTCICSKPETYVPSLLALLRLFCKHFELLLLKAIYFFKEFVGRLTKEEELTSTLLIWEIDNVA